MPARRPIRRSIKVAAPHTAPALRAALWIVPALVVAACSSESQPAAPHDTDASGFEISSGAAPDDDLIADGPALSAEPDGEQSENTIAPETTIPLPGDPFIADLVSDPVLDTAIDGIAPSGQATAGVVGNDPRFVEVQRFWDVTTETALYDLVAAVTDKGGLSRHVRCLAGPAGNASVVSGAYPSGDRWVSFRASRVESIGVALELVADLAEPTLQAPDIGAVQVNPTGSPVDGLSGEPRPAGLAFEDAFAESVLTGGPSLDCAPSLVTAAGG